MTDKSTYALSPKISLFLPSLDGGGAERVFVQLANEFATLGFRVDFALATARGPYLDELSADVRIINFGASGVLTSLPKLSHYLRQDKPDVMLSGLDHANTVAILAKFIARRGTRCVISVRSIPTAAYRGTKSVRTQILLQLMRVTYRFANRIIVNSEAVASDVSRFLRISRDGMEVVFNPVDLALIEALSREDVVHAWCKPGVPPIILGVGRLHILKDFQTLIEAFSNVRSKRDCRLVILGEGHDRAKLELLVRELGLHQDVCLPGFIRNPFAWMRHAKVLVSSSLTEGCPNVLMQALACGTPVVSTDCVGGSAEILEGGKWGRLVAVGDSDAMADAIVSTLDATHHPDGRQRAKDFAQERIVQQYLQVLLPNYRRPAVER